MQGDAQLDGAETLGTHWGVLGKALHALEHRVASRGQLQGTRGDIETRYGKACSEPGGGCLAAAATEIQHGSSSLQMRLEGFKA